MAEDWATLTSYRLHDLLMFSADTYFRLFEVVNRQWWPAPLAGAVLACGAWVAAWRRRAAPVTLALLSCAWGTVALLYFRDGFAAIHWLGAWWAGAFLAQSLLWLVWAAKARPMFAEDGPVRTAGMLMMMAAAAWPLLAPALGQPLWQAQVVGLAPDATLLLSLGLLLTLQPARPWAAALLALPLAWCAFSGATAWAMAQAWALVLPLAGVAAALALMTRRR
jgi:hypothetical protein